MSFEPRVAGPSGAGTLVRALHEAHARRAPIARDSNCYRVHDANADPVPGLTVDRFGEHAVVHAYEPEVARVSRDLGAALLAIGARGAYLKLRFPGAPAGPVGPLAGQAAEAQFSVEECGRRYWVRLDDGVETGLFVDQRENRNLVQAGCGGQRVLNLFAHTGAFSVAAGLGGAREVVSVDSSKRALARLDENLRLNALDPSQHRLLRADATNWLARAARRAPRFDWIVLDPPSFSSHLGKPFSVEKDYELLLVHCLRLLAPKGTLLAVTNHRGTTRARLATLAERAVRTADRKLAALEGRGPQLDCPLGRHPERATKSLLVRVAD